MSQENNKQEELKINKEVADRNFTNIRFRGLPVNGDGLFRFGYYVTGGQPLTPMIIEDNEQQFVWSVYSDTVGQITPVKDMYNRDIYIGDIVQFNDFSYAGIKYQVGYFEDGTIGFFPMNNEEEVTLFMEQEVINDEMWRKMEILGNIWSAPVDFNNPIKDYTQIPSQEETLDAVDVEDVITS